MNIKILISLSSCLCVILAGSVNAEIYTDYIGAGHWNGTDGVRASSFFAAGSEPAVTVEDPLLTEAHNQVWAGQHVGNDATGYGMWMTGSGGQEPYPPEYGSVPIFEGPAWIEWDLGSVYNLASMWVWNFNQPVGLGRGIKDARIQVSTDRVTWTEIFNGVLKKGTGQPMMPRTDFINIPSLDVRYVLLTATTNWGDSTPFYGVSEVRWDISQPVATAPYPADDSTVQGPLVPLKWRAGVGSLHQDVYFGTSYSAVNTATTASPMGVYKARQDANSFDPGALAYNTTYYWRVDQVTDTTVSKGAVWSFTVANDIVIDNFESYIDSNDLRLKWQAVAGTGSAIAIAAVPAMDNQSMQVTYANAAAPFVSKAQIAFATDQNWSGNGVFKSLSLSFFGQGTNTITTMSVIVEDSLGHIAQANYGGDPNNMKRADWHEWAVGFASLAGVDMTKVRKLTISAGNGTTASSGKLFFDNISRYALRCSEDVPADINNDCVVNFKDYTSIAGSWLTSSLWP